MRHSFFCRLLALLLALGCLLPVFGAAAAGYPLVGFTTDSLRLRQQPRDTAAVLCTIPRGDALLIDGESGSYYIVVYEGQRGYALKSYISTGDAAYPQPTAVPSAASESAYTLLSSGAQGDKVTVLQEALDELGFYSGQADGKFGSGTKSAVMDFQKMNGLAQTGAADGETQELLFEGKPKNSRGKAVAVNTVSCLDSAVIASGSSGSMVKRLQERLKALGYYTGSIDGACGSGTVRAIKAFQKKAGLSQTGRADSATRALLYAASAPAANATATPSPTATPRPYATYAPSATDAPLYPYTSYTTSSVNLRKSASSASTRLATLSRGAEITVLSMEGDYLKVSSGGRTGYIAAEFAYIPAQYLPGTSLDTDGEAQANYPYLRSGSTGKYVTVLQEALKELGFYAGSASGSYDAATLSAVKAFQKKNGLKQDGIISPEMQQLIFEGKPLNSRGKKTDVKTLPLIEGYEMRLNDRGEAVSRLQQQLAALGYYARTVTGVFDSATQKAVRAFQTEHHLYVDGVAGKKTQTLLNALTAPTATPGAYVPATTAPANTPLTAENVIIMQNGTRGLAVERLQKRLRELGYYTAEADGVYDSDEIAAVRAFQKKNGLKIDGIAGLDTQLRLYSDSAVPATTAALPLPTAAPVTPTPAPVLETLRLGSSGEGVTALQTWLTTYGYYSGKIDGIFGTDTASAVSRFQRANGLTADGVVGAATRSKLSGGSGVVIMATTPPAATAAPAQPAVTKLSAGDQGEAVTAMQKRLVELGYLNAADGIYGPRTYNAVVAFQRKNGLTADGIAGKMTLTRLNSSAAIAASNTILSVPGANSSASNTGSSSFTPPDASEVRYANWYTEIRARAKLMPDVVIYDPDSGLHFNLHMFSFGKHADSEPPTKEDTEILYEINGEDNWDPKYVWVIFSDGRVYIASIHSMGHTVDHTANNGMTGHICLHFPRIMSEAEATGPYAVRHQKEILYGWELTQAMAR